MLYRVVETVSEYRSYDILALLHHICKVISEIHHEVLLERILHHDASGVEVRTHIVIGLVRREILVTDPLAIEIKLEISQTCTVETRLLDSLA